MDQAQAGEPEVPAQLGYKEAWYAVAQALPVQDYPAVESENPAASDQSSQETERVPAAKQDFLYDETWYPPIMNKSNKSQDDDLQQFRL